MSRGWLVVVVLALCAAAGCTVSGSPVPTPGPTTSAAPSSAPSTRPREIRLDGIDPCTLLTEEQKKQLGLNRPPVRDTSFEPAYNGVTSLCSIRGDQPRDITVGVTLVVSAGISRYTPETVRATLTLTTVRGFSGLLVASAEYPEACTVVVDVAEGQLVDIQFRDGGSGNTVPQPDLCAGAQRTADLVMATLLAR